MTGVEIVGALLLADASLLALVPASRVKADALPENVTLPLLLVTDVSSVEHQYLRRGASVRCIERVAVTVRAASGNQRRAIMQAVRSVCSGWTGTMGDAVGISVLDAGRGPGVVGPGNSFEQTLDFKVSFEEPA